MPFFAYAFPSGKAYKHSPSPTPSNPLYTRETKQGTDLSEVTACKVDDAKPKRLDAVIWFSGLAVLAVFLIFGADPFYRLLSKAIPGGFFSPDFPPTTDPPGSMNDLTSHGIGFMFHSKHMLEITLGEANCCLAGQRRRSLY
jgi:hypothetical protein